MIMLTTTDDPNPKTTSSQIRECSFNSTPIHQKTSDVMITPSAPTPKHSLYLSNLDDQKFLRFHIKYLFLYDSSVCSDSLRRSLSRALVDYYPLAGRLRRCPTGGAGGNNVNQDKLRVDCNGEGALFCESSMDITADHFLQLSQKPNKSWRKLLPPLLQTDYSFLDIPPLLVQVTKLRCGGMLMCVAINHCLCDGIGSSQFLHAWAHLTKKPASDLPVSPIHYRQALRPRDPVNSQPTSDSNHGGYTRTAQNKGSDIPRPDINLTKYLQSTPLAPSSLTFTPSDILRLKQQCVPSLKCTAFEVLAFHTWRCWAKSLDLPSSLPVKLLFSVNFRNRIAELEIPAGFYGNAFVLGCAEASVKELVGSNMREGLRLVRRAKSAALTEETVRSVIDLMEDKTVETDVSNSLVISQWSRLGLEDLDFGEGKPLHMGPLSCNVFCLFLPVIGDPDAVRVLMSMPECVVRKFEFYMKELPFLDGGVGRIIGHGFHSADRIHLI